jgi:hypothetical protein
MGSSADSDDGASRTSIFDDSDVSEALSDDCYSTISIIDGSAPPDDDADESNPAGIEAGAEMQLGEVAGGDMHQTPGVIFERSPH